MDNDLTFPEALHVKINQYDKAEEAVWRAQHGSTWATRTVVQVKTCPFVFGVRGSVMADACFHFLLDRTGLHLTEAQARTVLAAGVRAAIRGLSDMSSARTAALSTLPPKPSDKAGKCVKTIIPQKPFKIRPWRTDRTGSTNGPCTKQTAYMCKAE